MNYQHEKELIASGYVPPVTLRDSFIFTSREACIHLRCDNEDVFIHRLLPLAFAGRDIYLHHSFAPSRDPAMASATRLLSPGELAAMIEGEYLGFDLVTDGIDEVKLHTVFNEARNVKVVINEYPNG